MNTHLKKLIKAGKFDYVNSDITEENFPSQEVSTDFELYYPAQVMSSEDVEKYAEEHNLRPANLYELLAYAKEGWNGKDWVMALGSSAVVDGPRGVPCLDGRGSGRGLGLRWRGGGWGGFCRFLLVRKPSDPLPLGTPGTLDSSASLPSLDAEEVIAEKALAAPEKKTTGEHFIDGIKSAQEHTMGAAGEPPYGSYPQSTQKQPCPCWCHTGPLPGCGCGCPKPTQKPECACQSPEEHEGHKAALETLSAMRGTLWEELALLRLKHCGCMNSDGEQELCKNCELWEATIQPELKARLGEKLTELEMKKYHSCSNCGLTDEEEREVELKNEQVEKFNAKLAELRTWLEIV